MSEKEKAMRRKRMAETSTPRLPTAALPASGLRVSGDRSPNSQPVAPPLCLQNRTQVREVNDRVELGCFAAFNQNNRADRHPYLGKRTTVAASMKHGPVPKAKTLTHRGFARNPERIISREAPML